MFRLKLFAFASLLLLGNCSSGQLSADAETTDKSEVKLKGSVQHSEYLPPIPQRVLKADILNGGTAGLNDKEMRKFKVPLWLVGVWQRDKCDEVMRVKLPGWQELKPAGITTAKVQDKFGNFKDKSGQFWQVFDANHASGQIDHGQTVDWHNAFDYDLIIIDQSTVLVEVRAWHVELNKKSKQVLTAYQDEEFNSFKRKADGKLATDSSIKVFDSQGKPILLSHTMSDEIRIVKP